jgi:hypothetical protein
VVKPYRERITSAIWMQSHSDYSIGTEGGAGNLVLMKCFEFT